MEYEFMTIDTPLPPSMPLPRAMLRLPISSTAKIMYARMLDDVLANGIEDINGILFICFPIVELSAALSRSTMTVKRSLNELEAAGLIVRVRQGFGEPNKIYALAVLVKVIFLFGLRRPCAALVKGAHGKHDMTMGISVALVVYAEVGAHSFGNKLRGTVFPDKPYLFLS